MEHTQRTLGRIAFAVLAVGVILAGMGAYLVYLGATGDTRFSLFGQEFQSSNSGIAAMFIGAVLAVLSLRRTLDSFDRTIQLQEGKKARGDLRLTDVRVTQDRMPSGPGQAEPAKCVVDFWVSNEGGSQVTITAVEFEVVDTARGELIKGAMPASATYDLDLTEVRESGGRVRCPVSQVVEPGTSDRFTVRLAAPGLGSGVFAAWKLTPVLVTNYGSVRGSAIEVWLPFREGDASFETLKYVERMSREHGVPG